VDGPRVSFTKGKTYKDMGLLNEAISEFEDALSDESLRYGASREIASCLTSLNMLDQAESVLLKALLFSDVPRNERLLTSLELANIYKHSGKLESALARLWQIKAEDAGFLPDIASRIRDLESQIDESPTGGSSQISQDEAPPDTGDPLDPDVGKSDAGHPDPRRRAPRVNLSHPVQYSFDQMSWSTGYSTDISISGMFILTYEPVPIGSLVFLKFDLPKSAGQREMEIVGQAVRQENRVEKKDGVLGMGIQFISMDSDLKALLNQFVEELQRDESATSPTDNKIRFQCDYCGRILTSPESFSGKKGLCVCGKSVPVPYAHHSPSQTNPLRGFHLAGCRIDRVIGKGSAATVYKGHHLALDIPVAIKILSSQQKKAGSEMARRFLKEARVIARINHANIVAVLNAGEEKSHSFIVMQYVPGGSLGKALRNKEELSTSDFIRIFLDVCKALFAAHKQSVVHGDVKPDNILLTPGGKAMLADFGLVKDLKVFKDTGNRSLAVGTPLYISPEQAKGEHATDFRSDIYSLGATMYHVIAGRPPFQGYTPQEVIKKHCSEAPEPLSRIAFDIPTELEDIVARAMAKRPEKRFQSVEELTRELAKVSGQMAVEQFRPLSKKLRQRISQRQD
jgi:tRNA A-37 threonylcarbamoyl transferase component Bud32/tetratricopeptide (TPR) repeat protein